jgi:protoporphyrinogen oxidase
VYTPKKTIMTKIKVAVIGAGPAGLTAAYELSKAGVEVDVYEASEAVGGMAKTITLWGQLVDLGPHRFFSSDPRVNKLWLEIIDRQYSMVSRLTRIYYKKTFFDYPLKALNALFGLGVLQSTFCVMSYLNAKLFPQKNEVTFEAWVSNRFGKRLFKIFFKSYSEKLWGISCKDLDADFAAQRIKKLSLYEAIKAAVFSGSGKVTHKTLVDEFAYPHQGAGAVYDEMAKKILALGGRIHLQAPIESVTPGELPKLKTVNGEEKRFDHIVSSMPITQLLANLQSPKEIGEHASALSFRNTVLVYLQVDADSPFPDQWIYVHSADLQTGRITNFKNWVPSILNGHSETILCLEYWCYDADALWVMNEESLIDLATQEIYQTGLVRHGRVMDGKVVRVPKCYPVYSTGYRQHLEPIEEFLSSLKGLSVIGRYGAFKYNNQDHSILMGLLAAENIAQGKSHNLWDINTDYEYQESCRITATGLDWEGDD